MRKKDHGRVREGIAGSEQSQCKGPQAARGLDVLKGKGQ